MNFNHELKLVVDVGRRAGDLLRSKQTKASVLSQVGKDIKLSADRDAEAMILDSLQNESGLPILSEEFGASGTINLDKTFWVVDPLDGTYNYSRGNVCYSLSIGLWHEGQPVLGYVSAPALGQEYWGSEVGGALFNGDPIPKRILIERDQAAVATGFPVNRSYEEASLASFISQVQKYKKVRMIGSAALALAWLSSGQYDVYLEEGVMLWDVCGGLALIKAIGGVYTLEPTAKAYCYDLQAAYRPELL